MKDRFKNPFDGTRKRSKPQPHTLKKFKQKYKKIKLEKIDGYYIDLETDYTFFDEEPEFDLDFKSENYIDNLKNYLD